MDERVKRIIDRSGSIVFFGGAGVSTESNIPDFRSESGLYRARSEYGYSPEQMLSHTFFVQKMDVFYDYYKKNLLYPDAMPNKAHIALARLEQESRLKAVVTQNIDGLHQKAGSKTVYELHGSVHRNYCMDCGEFHNLQYVIDSEGIPRCRKCGGVVKPDVVLYEEGLDENTIISSVRAIENCDTLIIGGTSLNVYPAAGFIQYFRGDNIILINKGETSYDGKADLVIREPIGEVLGE